MSNAVRVPGLFNLVLMPAKNRDDGEQDDAEHVVGRSLDVAAHRAAACSSDSASSCSASVRASSWYSGIANGVGGASGS